ncbi:MAG TPA: nucleotidyltransferase family protein [Anaerolineae bacterium]|nr:nucleotidyltransferase family protein [Anaerolineae bacterium]
MQREVVLQTLTTHKQELSAKYGVTRLGIFGSVARSQATEASDVDIVVEMPPDLFKMVHMKEDLEEILAAPVDLIRYHRFLNDYLKRRIDHEAIYV